MTLTFTLIGCFSQKMINRMQYGRYRIVKELGKGSMGVVYQAHDPQIDRMVALKVLRADRVASEAFVHRFLKEAKAVGRLSHPNIVVVYDIGEDHGTVYISMEYLEGKPLNEVLQSRKLSLEQALQLGIQVADGLDYAHRKGIVHRDIKPSNIIVQPDDRIKITDFGIAHIEDPDITHQTVAGEILGTPAYMSPEQVLGKPVDGRSDLFSLGVILYELAAGQRPFRGGSLATIFRSITDDDPREPLESITSLPKSFSALVLKALAKDPRQRYATCSDLGEALRVCLRQQESTTWPSQPTKAERRRGPLPIPMMLVALFVLSAVAAGAVLLYRGIRHAPVPVDSRQAHQQLPDQKALTDKPSSSSSPSDSSPQSAGEPSQTVKSEGTTSSTEGTAPGPSRADTLSRFGSLKLDSTPVGAEVSIDNQNRGLTPLEVKLPPGAYEVRLTLADHGDWEARVKVVEDRVTRIPVELMRIQ